MDPDGELRAERTHGRRRGGRARADAPPALSGVGWTLGFFGVSMLVASIFPADPVDGFPPGTPEGFPTSISTPGTIHFAAGALGFLALAVSCITVASALSRREDRRAARVSFLTGVSVVAGFFAPALVPAAGPVAGIWFSVVVGWGWLAWISARLYGAVGSVAGPG